MKKTSCFLILNLLAVLPSAYAQYPQIPDSVTNVRAAWHAAFMKASDEAWKKAMPIIEKEAKEGKPYVPWAARSNDLPQANIPAFPGAEGGGAFTFGGRGGKVITVTNLNNDGEGSLRRACEQGGARTIVFNVSGVINLTEPIVLRAPYVTIAGQTAPGDGVCVSGESFWVNTHDVVIRHMRFRRGATDVGSRDDALGGNPVGNVIYDHLSCSWGLDENVSIYRHMYLDTAGKNNKLPSVNVTMQNCISSEAIDLYNHSFGSTLGGVNSTFMRNLFSSNAGRNPSMSSGEFHFINNVIHNWSHRTGDGSGRAYNVINNYFKPGPVTKADEPIGYRVFRANGKGKIPGWVYVEGNVVEGNKAVSDDNWNGGVQENHSAEDLAYMRAKEPLPIKNPFPIMTAEKAYEFVLANVGATLPKRDAVDERVMRQVETNHIEWVEVDNTALLESLKLVRQTRRLPADSYKTGIIYDIRQVGGLPEYKGKPYVDADKDGMPDAWEKKYGLNPNDPSDANGDVSGDGYTNIEKYINGIDPTKKVDWTKPENNHDTLLGKKSLL